MGCQIATLLGERLLRCEGQGQRYQDGQRAAARREPNVYLPAAAGRLNQFGRHRPRDADHGRQRQHQLGPAERADYQICEWVFPGWNTNLAGDGPLFVPNSIIPPSLPNPNVNNLTVCADFTVASGQTRTFMVDNTPPPGGRALTIGFWKNWASCSDSNGRGQKFMTDLALGYASANTTNPPGGLVVSAQNAGSGWPNYAAAVPGLKGDPTSTEQNIASGGLH
jgi:hypothetical protein